MSERKVPKGAWTITFLLFFFMMVNFADKAIIGLAGVPIMKELGLTPKEFGLVGSSFFLLFSVSAVVTGFVVNRIQSRWALALMGLIWALVQFPMLGTVSIEFLIACRIVLGGAEGPAYPVAIHAAYKWFPDDKRAMPGAVIAQGAAFGVIIAIPLLNWIITHYNWHYAFGALGVAGLLWTIVWALLGKEGSVADHVQVGDESSVAPHEHRLSYRAILLSPTNLASWCAYFGAYFGLAIGLTWFTPFLIEGLGFSQSVAGKLTALPSLVSALVILVGSGLSQLLTKSGTSSRVARGIFTGLCSVIGGIALVVSTHIPDVTVRITLMIAGATLPSIAYTLVPMIMAEITPISQRGAVLAIGSAVGTSAGILAPYVMGSVVQGAATMTAGYNLGYTICGVATIIGGLVGLVFLQPEAQRAHYARLAAAT